MILGRTQYGVLKALVSNKLWHGSGYGCGWRWGSDSNTERVLNSLVKKGLVSVAEESVGWNVTSERMGQVYRPTKLGEAHVETIETARKYNKGA